MVLGKIVSEVKRESKNLGKYKKACLKQAEDLLSRSKIAQLRFLFSTPIPYERKIMKNLKISDIEMPQTFFSECNPKERLCFWGNKNDSRGSTSGTYTGDAFLSQLMSDAFCCRLQPKRCNLIECDFRILNSEMALI